MHVYLIYIYICIYRRHHVRRHRHGGLWHLRHLAGSGNFAIEIMQFGVRHWIRSAIAMQTSFLGKNKKCRGWLCCVMQTHIKTQARPQLWSGWAHVAGPSPQHGLGLVIEATNWSDPHIGRHRQQAKSNRQYATGERQWTIANRLQAIGSGLWAVGNVR